MWFIKMISDIFSMDDNYRKIKSPRKNFYYKATLFSKLFS